MIIVIPYLGELCNLWMNYVFFSSKWQDKRFKHSAQYIKELICIALSSVAKLMLWVVFFYEDPPIVLALSRQDILEGTDLSVNCEATPGNPRLSTFYWTNTRNDAFRQDGATLQLPKIERSSSSTYRCTVENNYNISEKGTDNVTMVVNVLCMFGILFLLLYIHDTCSIIMTQMHYKTCDKRRGILINIFGYNL